MRKQFYQTALGNCYGLKLAKCWLQFKRKLIVSFIIIFGRLSSPIIVILLRHRIRIMQNQKCYEQTRNSEKRDSNTANIVRVLIYMRLGNKLRSIWDPGQIDRVTAFANSDHNPRPSSMTLTFSPRQAMITTLTRARNQDQRSVGLKTGTETGWENGRTRPIALLCPLRRSAIFRSILAILRAMVGLGE